MRHAPLVFALSPLLCLAQACVAEDPVPPYLGVEYQLRCLGECFGTVDDPPHTIADVDGEGPMDVRCRAGESGEEVDISATCPAGAPGCGADGFRFAIENLSLQNKGGDPGTSCKVSVSEGNNDYSSPCTGGEIEDDLRCSIEFSVRNRDNGLSEIQGSVRCEDIPNEATATLTRHLVAPMTEDAVEFMVQGCENL